MDLPTRYRIVIAVCLKPQLLLHLNKKGREFDRHIYIQYINNVQLQSFSLKGLVKSFIFKSGSAHQSRKTHFLL